MKGATLEQNEEIVDALLGLLNSGKPVQEVLESRKLMIQDWLAKQPHPELAKPVSFSPPPAGCP